MRGNMDRPSIGALPAGTRNTIADVPGVTVGHATLSDGPVQTGVTILRLHGGTAALLRIPQLAAQRQKLLRKCDHAPSLQIRTIRILW